MIFFWTELEKFAGKNQTEISQFSRRGKKQIRMDESREDDSLGKKALEISKILR